MNTCIFIYPHAVMYEISLVSYFITGATKTPPLFVSTQGYPITMAEGMTIIPDRKLEELDPRDIDAMIIPGGPIDTIEDKQGLAAFLRQLKDNSAIIGGICNGSIVVQQAFDMNGSIPKTTRNISNQIILSPPNEYVDFALEIGKALDIFIDEEDYLETVRFFKKFLPG